MGRFPDGSWIFDSFPRQHPQVLYGHHHACNHEPLHRPHGGEVAVGRPGADGARLQQRSALHVKVLLAPAVRYNLTNLVADALSSQLSRGLTSALIMHLGPSVHQDVAAAIKAPLEEMISMHLALAIPEQVESVVPYLVERSLPMVLTRSLTRTLTHALVPSLTHVLTHTKHQDYWCNLCFYN